MRWSISVIKVGVLYVGIVYVLKSLKEKLAWSTDKWLWDISNLMVIST